MVFGARAPRSEREGYPRLETLPKICLVVCDAPDTAMMTAGLTRPHAAIPEAHAHAVPRRSLGEVGEDDGGDGHRGLRLSIKPLQNTTPPAERTVFLHLPLQLREASLHKVPSDPLEGTIRVGRRAWTLATEPRVRSEEAAADRSGAEAEAKSPRLWDELLARIIRAGVADHIPAKALMPTDFGRHSRHDVARLQLPIKNLKKALYLPMQGLPVEVVPIITTLLPQAIMKRRPPLPIEAVPVRMGGKGAEPPNRSPTEATQVQQLAWRLEVASNAEADRKEALHHESQIGHRRPTLRSTIDGCWNQHCRRGTRRANVVALLAMACTAEGGVPVAAAHPPFGSAL
mmetsp:Transcript_85179/g.182554  ORF Transcript_85179/g.182554 Transcript_85179/m.182554 type:complete len:344 (+) Transcript_85179:26-1057(+)